MLAMSLFYKALAIHVFLILLQSIVALGFNPFVHSA
jgi:hypothetical protein